MATFTKYEKEKWIKEKNKFAGRFGTNWNFPKSSAFSFKNDPLKRELKLSQHPVFLATISSYNWKPVKEKWVHFLQQERKMIFSERFLTAYQTRLLLQI